MTSRLAFPETLFRGLDGREASPFGRLATAACAMTIITGIGVAWAPAIPSAIRSPVLVLLLAGWTFSTLAASVAGARLAWRRSLSPTDLLMTVVAGVGALIIVLNAVQLELIRVLGRRPAFMWHEWPLSHAWAIARSGDVAHALDYAGAGLDYHVGPAWLAGAFQHLFGTGVEHVLFGVFPLVCALAILVTGMVLLRLTGVSYRTAAVAVVLTITLPLILETPGGLLALRFDRLTQYSSWHYLGAHMMVNSYLALAVGLASLAVLCNREVRLPMLLAASAGLAALAQIKPQYFIGIGLVAGVLGVGRAVGAAGPRDLRPLVAAILALVLALVARVLLPGDLMMVGAPQLIPGPERFRIAELYRVSTGVMVAAVIAWLLQRRYRTPHSTGPASTLEFLVGAAAALFLLAGGFHFIRFPFLPEGFSRWQAMGLPDSRETRWAVEQLGEQIPQATRFFALLFGMGVLVAHVRRLARPWVLALSGVALAIVLSPVPLFLPSVVQGTGVTEDGDLLSALKSVPVHQTLLIASDLADPAQDYDGALRASQLTAYDGHAFWVANLQYVHYQRDDAVARLSDLQRFMGNPWTPWHDAWLARHGITHVLVNTRCMPAWVAAPGPSLQVERQLPRWTVYRVQPVVALAEPGTAPPPRRLRPAYGKSDCLFGGSVQPAVATGQGP